MILPLCLDRIPELLGALVAARRNWTPTGAAVRLQIDESGDDRLFGATFRGVIVATKMDDDGMPYQALITLTNPIAYDGHYRNPAILQVTTMPQARWHRLHRLLITWAAVRVADASAGPAGADQRPIALARMTLEVAGSGDVSVD